MNELCKELLMSYPAHMFVSVILNTGTQLAVATLLNCNEQVKIEYHQTWLSLIDTFKTQEVYVVQKWLFLDLLHLYSQINLLLSYLTDDPRKSIKLTVVKNLFTLAKKAPHLWQVEYVDVSNCTYCLRVVNSSFCLIIRNLIIPPIRFWLTMVFCILLKYAV